MIVFGESENYRVDLGFEEGTTEDYLSEFSGQDFSTYDDDNDQSNSDNCAKKCGAGFWYNNCDLGGNEKGTINQHKDSICGGFSWDKPDPKIELKKTELYLFCSEDD